MERRKVYDSDSTEEIDSDDEEIIRPLTLTKKKENSLRELKV